jgi:FKBP-type peptidyl-prolyl cis-trans isomerase FkpA
VDGLSSRGSTKGVDVIKKTLALALFGCLAAISCSSAAGPTAGSEPKTDDEKTLYTLGVFLSNSISSFNLNASEIEFVKGGLTDGALHRQPKVDPAAYQQKLQQLAQTRAASGSAVDRKAGSDFLAKTSLEKGAVKGPGGLIIEEVKAGAGASPKPTDTVKVNYKGTLIDGTVFDSSDAHGGAPAVFQLNGVIPCWTQGLQMMKVGGKSRLVCPPEMAYGDRGAPPRIRPGSTLVFEVELVDIVK